MAVRRAALLTVGTTADRVKARSLAADDDRGPGGPGTRASGAASLAGDRRAT